jgi:hypothetical protein
MIETAQLHGFDPQAYGQAIGGGAAGHHAGGARGPIGKEEDHGRQVVDLPVSASFEAAL